MGLSPNSIRWVRSDLGTPELVSEVRAVLLGTVPLTCGVYSNVAAWHQQASWVTGLLPYVGPPLPSSHATS